MSARFIDIFFPPSSGVKCMWTHKSKQSSEEEYVSVSADQLLR